jgi:hypothetical protein
MTFIRSRNCRATFPIPRSTNRELRTTKDEIAAKNPHNEDPMTEKFDDPQKRAAADKQSDSEIRPSADDINPGVTNVQPSVDDEGRTTRHPEQPGRMKNETAIRQQEELRSERDHGYGSEYIGDEYKDIEVEDHEQDEEAA